MTAPGTEDELVLRPMTESDIAGAVAVIDTTDDDDAEAALASYKEKGGIENQFVLIEDDQVIGVTGFETPPNCENTHWLSWTYVHVDHQRKGHGRRMLVDVIDYLKERDGRMLFIKVSDYAEVSDSGETLPSIYAAAMSLYKSHGFVNEVTHADYYDKGESQIIMSLRLSQNRAPREPVEPENCPVTFNSVFEIADTDDAYSFGWHDKGKQCFSKQDVELGIEEVRTLEGRVIFLSFPSNYHHVRDTLYSAGFSNAGVVEDYYEDDVHEQHFALTI